MLWILATLVAAAVQTARNAMQSSLTAALGTLGATQVRFVYGWPFAVAVPGRGGRRRGHRACPRRRRSSSPTRPAAPSRRSPERRCCSPRCTRARSPWPRRSARPKPCKSRSSASCILGEHLTLARGVAIVDRDGRRRARGRRPRREAGTRRAGDPRCSASRRAACFALASVGFRGGILELGDDAYYLRAATTLTWALSLQTLLLGAWLALFARPRARRQLQAVAAIAARRLASARARRSSGFSASR